MRLFKMTIMGLLSFGAVGTVFANSPVVKAQQYMDIHLATSQPEGFKFSTKAEPNEHYGLECKIKNDYSYTPVEFFYTVKDSGEMAEQTIEPDAAVKIDPFEPDSSGTLAFHLKFPADIKSRSENVICILKSS